MTKIAHTAKDLIDALGGPSKVAEWAGMTGHSGVSNWIERGFIPAGWHLRLLIEARRRQVEVDLVAVFGLSPEDARLLNDVTLSSERAAVAASLAR